MTIEDATTDDDLSTLCSCNTRVDDHAFEKYMSDRFKSIALHSAQQVGEEKRKT